MTEDKKSSNALDNIRELVKNKQSVSVDEPRVKIVELQLDAIKALANNENSIFSEMSRQETFDVALALSFSNDPLPNINHKLKTAGIDYDLTLPVLDGFITKMLVNRHSLDRQRVVEFISALKAVNTSMPMQDDEKKGILGGRKVF